MKRLLTATTGLALLSAVIAFSVAAAPPDSREIRRLNLEGKSEDLPFTHVVDTGATVYLSGGLGLDPETGMAPADIHREIRLMLDGMKAKLALAGLTMDDLVSVQIFSTDLGRYREFNAIYRTYFKEHPPARAFIGAGGLLRGAHFEIQGIAVRR